MISSSFFKLSFYDKIGYVVDYCTNLEKESGRKGPDRIVLGSYFFERLRPYFRMRSCREFYIDKQQQTPYGAMLSGLGTGARTPVEVKTRRVQKFVLFGLIVEQHSDPFELDIY